MSTRLKRLIAVPVVATLLLAGIAVSQHHEETTPVVMGTVTPGNDISAVHQKEAEERLAAEAAAAAEQKALQEAEAARLAQVQAQKARANRGAPRRAPAPRYGGMPSIGQADELGWCESGRNPQRVSASGKYFGAFQFALPTWHNFRSGNPTSYTYEQQREVVLSYFPLSSWPSQFPGCYRKLHARGIV